MAVPGQTLPVPCSLHASHWHPALPSPALLNGTSVGTCSGGIDTVESTCLMFIPSYSTYQSPEVEALELNKAQGHEWAPGSLSWWGNPAQGSGVGIGWALRFPPTEDIL